MRHAGWSREEITMSLSNSRYHFLVGFAVLCSCASFCRAQSDDIRQLLRYSREPAPHTHLIAFRPGKARGEPGLSGWTLFSVSTMATRTVDDLIEAEIAMMPHTTGYLLPNPLKWRYTPRGQVAAEGKIVGTRDNPDGLTGLLAPFPVAGFPWLPEDRVWAGDKWTEDWFVVDNDMSGKSRPFAVNVKYTFDRLTTDRNRRYANITFDGRGQQKTLSDEVGEVVHEVNVSGTWLFDIDAGVDVLLRIHLSQQWAAGGEEPERVEATIEKVLSKSVVVPTDWEEAKEAAAERQRQKEEEERARKEGLLPKLRDGTMDPDPVTRAKWYCSVAKASFWREVDGISGLLVEGIEREKDPHVRGCILLAVVAYKCEAALPHALALLSDTRKLLRWRFPDEDKFRYTAANKEAGSQYEIRVCELAAWAVEQLTGKDYGFVACYESRDDMPEIIERIRKDYPAKDESKE